MIWFLLICIWCWWLFMDIEDLRQFLVIAQVNNLQLASLELNITAGALSKVIKRLETKLNTQLFDRSGRNIILNLQGERFRQYAQNIVHEFDQVLSEFGSVSNKIKVNITGPSVLVQFWLPQLIEKLGKDNCEVNLQVDWEGQALNQVENGMMHMALATQFASFERSNNSDLTSVVLGETVFRVVAAENHTLFNDYPDGQINCSQLQDYIFACPSVSPFCGIKRGVGSDGWQDEKVPRTIGFRCNDFSVLMSLVSQGDALAYVPDFIAEQYGLNVVEVSDINHVNKEVIALYYKPSKAAGWLNKFIHSIAK